MKRLPLYASYILAMVCGIACQRNQEQVNNKERTSFSTPEEAASKAKSDLLAVLRSGKSINLGVDQAAIEKSQPAPSIKHYQITFDQLLAAGSSNTFRGLMQNELTTVVPFVADNKVVTIAELAKDDKGWRVASLANKSVTNDLNLLGGALGESQGEIIMCDLPNSSIKVYGVKKNDAEMFYTDYPGFSLREGVSAERFLAVLKGDAAEFQRKFSDALKNQKLAH